MPDGDPGLLISEAAALLGISIKAIRTYHAAGILPELDRDESGYRRYDASQLATLARITRLRRIGLPLREIGPLVAPGAPAGPALGDRLGELAGHLRHEIDERQQRLALVEQLLSDAVDDPLAASASDLWEELSVAIARSAVPDMTAGEELVERQLARAMSLLTPDSTPWDEDQMRVAMEALRVHLSRDPAVHGERHRRFHALAGADPDDPRVNALIADTVEFLRDAMGALDEASLPPQPVPGADELRRLRSGMEAALQVLAPAQRRVVQAVLDAMFEEQAEADRDGGAVRPRRGEQPGA